MILLFIAGMDFNAYYGLLEYVHDVVGWWLGSG